MASRDREIAPATRVSSFHQCMVSSPATTTTSCAPSSNPLRTWLSAPALTRPSSNFPRLWLFNTTITRALIGVGLGHLRPQAEVSQRQRGKLPPHHDREINLWRMNYNKVRSLSNKKICFIFCLWLGCFKITFYMLKVATRFNCTSFSLNLTCLVLLGETLLYVDCLLDI